MTFDTCYGEGHLARMIRSSTFEAGPVGVLALDRGPREAVFSKTPVVDLNISTRARNCLETAKIYWIEDLVKVSAAELLKIRSFGSTTLREIRRELKIRGLCLREDQGES